MRRLVFITLSLAIFPLAYNSCSGSLFGGTGSASRGGTIVGTPLVQFSIEGFAGTSQIKICPERMELKSNDTTTIINLDATELILDSKGTLLTTSLTASNSYLETNLVLSNRCSLGKSIEITNANGTFSSADTLKLHFEGFVHVDRPMRVGLESQKIEDAAATIADASTLKTTVELVTQKFEDLDGLVIALSDDIQTKVNANPEGTKFYLEGGIHRLQVVIPKNDDKFFGLSGAIMSGARLLTSFTQELGYWVATGQTQQGQVHGLCEPSFPRCQYPEDFFIDDQPLFHVAALSDVGPGKYFFDYNNDKIYFADDPTGRKVETSVARAAFRGPAQNVIVAGLTIEKYAIPAQMGAIGDQYPGAGWIVENNEIRLNHGAGLRLNGGRAVANYIHHNGQMAISGTGSSLLIERNHLSYNNYAGHQYGWESGGAKLTGASQLKLRCNYVHDNQGPGLIAETDIINFLMEKNLVLNNKTAGIYLGTSYSGIIRNNVSKNNSTNYSAWLFGSQILSIASQDVEIYNNIVEVSSAGGNGLSVLNQDRGSGLYGTYYARNNYVHHNVVTYLGNSGQSGAATDFDSVNFWATGNNRFDFNTYHAPDLTLSRWSWNGANRNWAGLQAQGQEANGTADTNVQVDTTPLGVPACSP